MDNVQMNNVQNVQTNHQDNDSKKIITMLILIFILMVCTTGATYAYFALSATNNTATGTVATANLSVTVTPVALKTGNTGIMVPQLETALGTAMNDTNKCVDGNNNIICKAYTIVVTNDSTAAVKVKGTIQFSGNENMPNLKWRRATGSTTLGDTGVSIAVGNDVSTTYDIVAGTSCYVEQNSKQDVGCTDINLKQAGVDGSSVTYYIVVWINETGAQQTDSGSWRGIIKFEGENGTGVTSTIR